LSFIRDRAPIGMRGASGATGYPAKEMRCVSPEVDALQL
jgi:hypothetical protein